MELAHQQQYQNQRTSRSQLCLKLPNRGVCAASGSGLGHLLVPLLLPNHLIHQCRSHLYSSASQTLPFAFL